MICNILETSLEGLVISSNCSVRKYTTEQLYCAKVVYFNKEQLETAPDSWHMSHVTSYQKTRNADGDQE